jgi:hypothetical protein
MFSSARGHRLSDQRATGDLLQKIESASNPWAVRFLEQDIFQPVTRQRSGLATRAPSRPPMSKVIARGSLRSRGLSSVSLFPVPQPDRLCNEDRNYASQQDPGQDTQDDHNRRGHRKLLVDGPPRLGRRAWSQAAGGRHTERDSRAIATTVSGHTPAASRTLRKSQAYSDTVRCCFSSFFGKSSCNKYDYRRIHSKGV